MENHTPTQRGTLGRELHGSGVVANLDKILRQFATNEEIMNICHAVASYDALLEALNYVNDWLNGTEKNTKDQMRFFVASVIAQTEVK